MTQQSKDTGDTPTSADANSSSIPDETTLPQWDSSSYQRDGVAGPITVFSPQEAQEILKNFHEWVSTSFPNHRVTGDWRFKPHLHLVFVNRIVHHPALISAVQQVLQTRNVLLWSSDFNIKYPETEAWYPPHQDATYAGLHPANQCVTAWVALSDPVSDKEGCLMFWKGSHRLGQLPHEENVSKDNNNLLSRGQRITSTPDEQLRLDDDDDGDENSSRSPELVSIPLRGGQATLHNFYTIHKSGPNRSKYPRVGLALRYIDADVRQTGSVRESVTLVSGKTIHDGFDLEPILPIDGSATSEDIQRGKEAHRDSMQRESANYFDGSTADTRGYDQQIASKSNGM